MSEIKSIEDIKNVFYINLLTRPDRKAHIETQLKRVGFTTFERFNAIKMPAGNNMNANSNGRIGCSMSHIKCLEIAKERGYNHLLICEDDTTHGMWCFLPATIYHLMSVLMIRA